MTDYERVQHGMDKGAVWRFDVPDLPGEHRQLIIFATNIRIERGTQKAYIKVGYPGNRAFASDDLELLSDGERGRLANRVAEHVWQVKYQDKKAIALREKMMLFCDGLYEFWIGEHSGEWVKGDAEPSAPKWGVVGLSLEGAVGIHVGDAKAGKSTLDRVMAASLQYDRNGIIPMKSPGNVVWINAEEPKDEHTRQFGNVFAALGLERTSSIFTIHAHGLPIQALVPRVERAVQKIDAKYIHVDSLSRLAQGMNLNENATATLLMDAFSAFGCSTSFIGHTGQENRHRLAGSKHFENAARLVVRIQSRMSIGGADPELTRGLRSVVTHANGAIETEPLYWTLRYHRDHGLIAIEPADKDEWPGLKCDAWVGEKRCDRRTWDGVERNGRVRCARHRDEEDE